MTTATIQDQIAILEEKESRLLAEDKVNWEELKATQDRLTELRAKLQEQQKQQAEVAQRVEAAIVETSETVDNLEIMPGLMLRDVITDPEAYQLVSIAFKTKMNEKDTKYINELTDVTNQYKEQLRAASERETNLQYQVQQKDKTIDELNDQATELRKQVNTLEFEKEEAFKYRDNAVAEMDGLKLVIEEKDKHIETLRAEIAVGAKGAQAIDQTEQLRKAAEDWKNSRIKVTNIRWEDELRKTHYLAEDMDGTTIRFGRFDKGQYREVTEEEASRFRAEQAANAVVEVAPTVEESLPDSTLVEVPEVEPVEQFREETGPIMDAGSEVADEQQGVQLPSTEEIYRRIQALELGQAELRGRVDTLQQKVGA